jgi:hypothetical protein
MIFRDYRHYGDDSARRTLLGRKILKRIQKITGRPMPGWYDTDARHASVPAREA